MTWRRLVVLVSGLSADSLWHHRNRDDGGTPTIDDPVEASAAFQSLTGITLTRPDTEGATG